MSRRKTVLFMLVLPITTLFVGCNSTLTAVSGKYYYYEITDDRVTFFSWNPMSQQYHTAVLMEADPKTFRQVTSQYGKDASHVFHKSLPIAGDDPSRFVLLKEGYAVDATQIFYNRKRLTGADPRTFERLDYGWSRDADNIYGK